MINKISKFKYIIKAENILILFFFLLTIFTLSAFENFLFIRYLLFGISIVLIYLYFQKKKIEFLIYPILYLIFFTTYNIYYSFGWSLWSVMLVLILLLNIVIYFTINNIQFENTINKLSNELKYFYFVLINLLIVEIFLTLIPWPTDPRGKSIILLVSFYIIEGLITAWQNNKFSFKETSQYLTVGIIIISVIIITTTWYAY